MLCNIKPVPITNLITTFLPKFQGVGSGPPVPPSGSALGIFLYLYRFISFPNEKNLDWSKLKAFADDKINLTRKLKFDLEWVENIVEKNEKMLDTRIFSFSHNVFKGFTDTLPGKQSHELFGKKKR